jgi:hypothetical protein
MDKTVMGERVVGAANGAAMASVAAAGVGAVALGAFVLLAEAGVWSAPALYGPAGGLSGRTTLAVLVWLATWGGLSVRWRRREIAPATTLRIALVGIGFGVVATFPPFWHLIP